MVLILTVEIVIIGRRGESGVFGKVILRQRSSAAKFIAAARQDSSDDPQHEQEDEELPSSSGQSSYIEAHRCRSLLLYLLLASFLFDRLEKKERAKDLLRWRSQERTKQCDDEPP